MKGWVITAGEDKVATGSVVHQEMIEYQILDGLLFDARAQNPQMLTVLTGSELMARSQTLTLVESREIRCRSSALKRESTN